MSSVRSTYQVHAEVLETGVASTEFDDAKAGHPLARRLNRMERVVAAYRGQVDKRLSNGLRIVFDTADAALLGTCEMQHRCSALPQVSLHRLALRIGIHGGIVRQRAKDGAEDAWLVASNLAVADDGIVASDAVVVALNSELRKLTQPLQHLPGELTAHKVDWRSEIPTAAFGGESLWPASMGTHPAGTCLILHYGLKSFELTQAHPLATIGRDPLSDLVWVDARASRSHCRVERRVDGIVLTDTSSNGTYVTPDQGAELLVKKASLVLKGKGTLFFGFSGSGERRGGVRYEVF